uniref:Retrotransposon Copia-like N-terminal domain-containing protein n=1 Tax=Nicotiana tabacum TaxID=4097 RepID=A0A1S3YLT4_TOBAC|nr:PREDICTED: uncharacterized protein LOC107777657 [Nicotiana tabacum]
MTKDGNTSRVINVDNTTGINTIVQFNLASQLPIKLSGIHNFSTWKAQFSILMHGHDLYGHLDRSTSIPTSSTTFDTNINPNPAYTLWFRQDNAFMASVDPTIASTVVASNTSKQAWGSLHTAYLLSNKLATVVAHVTNSELIVKILSGLGPEFREISTTIRACDTTVTYEELYEKLLDHELFLRHEEAKKMSSPITIVVATRNKPTNNYNNRNNRRENYNGTPTQNPQPWRQNARSNPPAQCVRRSKSHNHFEAKANYACGFTSTANPWIMDSGATHHLTTEPHNLQEYHGSENVSMGDGPENASTTGARPE